MKLAVAAALIALASPALARVQDDLSTKSAKAPKPKKICRAQHVTGSNMATTTCHTQAEWDEIAQTEQASVDSYRQQSTKTH